MTARRSRILVLEPWYGGSHAAWADGLAAHSRHDITLVTLEASFWRWRMRGSALTLARLVADVAAREGPPDLVVVSDFTDLAAFAGYTRRTLAGVPIALYLHENQLVHPPSRTGEADELYATINWTSLVAADAVFCNSAFHRNALLGALPGFLGLAPDHALLDEVAGVAAKTSVLPVGFELDDLLAGGRTDGRGRGAGGKDVGSGGAAPLIVWNQRWDHDKDPEALFRVLRALARDGVAFRFALAGENRRHDPQEFDAVVQALGARVEHVGWLARPEYVDLLLRSDVVVSTARHEFFGIAAVEAMAAGVVPLLPDRLSYPELVPSVFHPACLYPARLYDHLHAVLTDLAGARTKVEGLRASMGRFAWPAVIRAYDDAFDSVIERDRRPAPDRPGS